MDLSELSYEGLMHLLFNLEKMVNCGNCTRSKYLYKEDCIRRGCVNYSMWIGRENKESDIK